jgi:hypothetical protein
VIQPSFQELYSAKTDDELLALAADSASLREDAKAVLAQELERRNLQPPTLQGGTGGNNEEARDAERMTLAHGWAALDILMRETVRRLARFGFLPSYPKVASWRTGLTAPRALVFASGLLLNTCIALLGTPLLKAGIGTMFHPNSFSGLLWKSLALDFLGAAGLGFSVCRVWRSRSAVWTWVLPVLWFAVRFVPTAFSGGNKSVLVGHSLWSQFYGSECASGLQSERCLNFILFMLPLVTSLVRGVSYSLGAWVSSMLPPQFKRVQEVAAGAITTADSR